MQGAVDGQVGRIAMRIAADDPGELTGESKVYERLLPLAGARVLELGCGKAEHTRGIARRHPETQIVALEVDEVQLAENLAGPQLPNLRFGRGGAQAIDHPDGSFDVVMMFKSLHHVPGAVLDQAMDEIARVTKPGGLVYVSEPIFAGAYNEVIRVFHDEQKVRQAAFDAVAGAVGRGRFELVSQTFFRSPVVFEDFADFERKMIGATHTIHRLTDAQYREVRERFAAHVAKAGAPRFEAPMRVDLLRRPE
ncbi:MAG TPA: class I SAM-dependent methyltransferase [Burkholderiaceae bacterium]|nr:class I SAM-dependent methyltransferase [Burkholderiaceae bacterium]